VLLLLGAQAQAAPPTIPGATYIGSDQCKGCHEDGGAGPVECAACHVMK